MDYEKLAAEFMDILPKLLQIPMQKDADRLVRGEMFALRYLFEEGPQTPGKISEKMNISTARTAKPCDPDGEGSAAYCRPQKAFSEDGHRHDESAWRA